MRNFFSILANLDNLLGGGDNILLPQPLDPQVAAPQQNGHNAGPPEAMDQNPNEGGGGPAGNGDAPGDGGAPPVRVRYSIIPQSKCQSGLWGKIP